MFLASIDQEIEIIIDNQSSTKFSFDSYVCGFYVYKDDSSPAIREGYQKEGEKYISFQ